MEGPLSTELGETHSAQGNHGRLHRRGGLWLVLEFGQEFAGGAAEASQAEALQRSGGLNVS